MITLKQLVLPILLFISIISFADEKIPDGGFETGFVDGGNNAYYKVDWNTVWRTWPHIAFSTDETTKHTGNKSLKLDYSEYSGALSYNPTFRCEAYPELESGTNKFSFYYKTDKDYSTSSFIINIKDGVQGGTTTAIESFSIPVDAAAKDGFVLLEIEFTTDAAIGSFLPFIELPFLGEGGFIHIDDVLVEKINTVPTAYNPSPIQGAVQVPTASTLSWLPGVGGVKRNVYLGQSETSLEQITKEISSLEIELNDLNYETQYVWRVDEIDANGVVSTGELWTFTTKSYFEEMMQKFQEERVESSTQISWNQFGPGNAGFVNFLRYHPLLPDFCVTSPDMNNTYQTEDNGKSWHTIKDVDGESEFSRLYDMYYSSKTAKFALAIECSRLYASNDTARSWQNITHCPWYDADSDGFDTRSWYRKVSAIGLDPQDDNTWYVGAGNINRGQQHLWSSIKDAKAENPRGVDSDYMGTIWKTTDAGKSWTTLSTGLNEKAQFLRIIIHPTNSDIVFAASQYGLYKSKDAGNSWKNIGELAFENNTIMDMDFYYDEESGDFILYVIDQVRYLPNNTTTRCTGGIYKSTDNGTNWTNITGDLGLDINRLTGGVPENYYQYIAYWLGITKDVAKSTYPELPTAALQYFNSLNVDPSRPDALYVGFYDAQIQKSITPGRLWQTNNGGEHWVNIARDFAPAWEADKEYWQERNNPYTDNMEMGHAPFNQQWGQNYPLRSLRYCAVNTRGEIMILSAHNTLLSTDLGVSFTQVDETYTANGNIIGNGNSNLPGECLYLDKRLGEDIGFFGSGEHHLWISTTDAEEDQQAVKFLEESQESIFAVATHPWDENTVFTTSMRQKDLDRIYKSTDKGETFSDWGQATLAEEWMRTNHIRIDPINPNNMYFGVTDVSGSGGGSNQNGPDSDKEGGFNKSTDGGRSFQTSNSGLPDFVYVRDIEFDPRDKTSSSLFIAAPYNPIAKTNGGLFFSENKGETWTEISVDEKLEGINNIAFDHTGRMYVTAGRRSAANNGGGLFYSDDYGTTWTKLFEGPYVENFDVSPFDRNLLIFSMGTLAKNPGMYLSTDGGATWNKNNTNIGQPDKISQVEFDLHNPNKIWSSVTGSGFMKGYFPDAVKPITLSPGTDKITLGETLQLSVIDAGNTGIVSYKSANETIASVDASGMITATGIGAVKIWAVSEDNQYSDFIYLVVDQSTSSDIPSKNDVKVFPNPVQSELFIKGLESIAELDIYSNTGQLLYRGQFQPNGSLNVDRLDRGIYFYKLSYSGKVKTGKFLKK